jgi:hypothetical protein
MCRNPDWIVRTNDLKLDGRAARFAFSCPHVDTTIFWPSVWSGLKTP